MNVAYPNPEAISPIRETRRALRVSLICSRIAGGILLLSLMVAAVAAAGDSPTKAVRRSPKPVAAASIKAIPTLAVGDLYALVVGLSKYESKDVPALGLSDKDARDFREFLESQKHLFRRTHITLLINERATRIEVERQLYHEIRKAGKNDTVILFFSGHGSVDPTQPGEFFFLTYDSHPDYLSASGVNMSGLKFLKRMDCPRILLIADACNSGGFSRERTKATISPLKTFIREFADSVGRVVLTSSRPEEYSVEKSYLGNSVFTHFLLEGLRGGADKDANGVITINEAYRYAYDYTKNETQGAQHPQFDGRVEGSFPLAITGAVESGPVTTLELSTNVPGADVFVGGTPVGRTDQSGALFMKYLPMGEKITVRLKKQGWKDTEAGPFVFSKKKLHVAPGRLELRPMLAALELRTHPPDVVVTVGGREVGRTGRNGALMIRDVQVTVPHSLEFRKDGYRTESMTISIPAEQEGRTYRPEMVRLQSETVRRRPRRTERDEAGTSRPPQSAAPASRVPERSAPSSYGDGDTDFSSNFGIPDQATRYLHFDHP